jgi:uncharacterized membrane protein
LGTLAGYFALSGDIPSGDWGELWIFLMFAFVGPISIACIQLWGFLYVGLIAWFAYALVFEDAARIRTAGLILFPQFHCTVITLGVVIGEGMDTEMVVRSIIVGVFLALCAVPAFVIWMRTRDQPTRTCTRPRTRGA